MTDVEMGSIKRLFNKCLEVNLKEKAYVDFQLTSGPDKVKVVERELNKWI